MPAARCRKGVNKPQADQAIVQETWMLDIAEYKRRQKAAVRQGARHMVAGSYEEKCLLTAPSHVAFFQRIQRGGVQRGKVRIPKGFAALNYFVASGPYWEARPDQWASKAHRVAARRSLKFVGMVDRCMDPVFDSFSSLQDVANDPPEGATLAVRPCGTMDFHHIGPKALPGQVAGGFDFPGGMTPDVTARDNDTPVDHRGISPLCLFASPVEIRPIELPVELADKYAELLGWPGYNPVNNLNNQDGLHPGAIDMSFLDLFEAASGAPVARNPDNSINLNDLARRIRQFYATAAADQPYPGSFVLSQAARMDNDARICFFTQFPADRGSHIKARGRL